MSGRDERKPFALTPWEPPPTFAEWLGEVAKLAGYSNAAELVVETGTCCWVDYFKGGNTPAETWAEECSNG